MKDPVQSLSGSQYLLPGLNALAQLIHDNAVAKGWWPIDKARPFDGQIALIHSEASEALEEWRNGHQPAETYFKLTIDNRVNLGPSDFKHEDGYLWVRNYSHEFDRSEPEWLKLDLEQLRRMPGLQGSVKPEGIPTELADIIIRVLDTCAAYGIDIERAISDKMAYNERRPYRHGGKRS